MLAGTPASGDKAFIECESNSPDYSDVAKVPMKWIKQQIAFSRHQCRRQAKHHRLRLGQPIIAQPLKRGRHGMPTPIARQIRSRYLGDFDSRRHLNLNRHQVQRQQVQVTVHQDLKAGQSQGLGCVRNQTPRCVPTARRKQTTSTVQRTPREGSATDTPNAHYAYIP